MQNRSAKRLRPDEVLEVGELVQEDLLAVSEDFVDLRVDTLENRFTAVWKRRVHISGSFAFTWERTPSQSSFLLSCHGGEAGPPSSWRSSVGGAGRAGCHGRLPERDVGRRRRRANTAHGSPSGASPAWERSPPSAHPAAWISAAEEDSLRKAVAILCFNFALSGIICFN